MRQIVVIGARDHAAEIIAAARLSRTVVRGVYDDDSDLWGRLIADVPIKGTSESSHSLGVAGPCWPFRIRTAARNWPSSCISPGPP